MTAPPHYLENATDLASHNYQNGMADAAPMPFWKESQDGKTATMVTFGGQTHLHRFVSDCLRSGGLSVGNCLLEPPALVAYCQQLVEEIEKVIEGKENRGG